MSEVANEVALVGRAVEVGIIAKSDGWLSFEGYRIGLGHENAAIFLRNNPDMAGKIIAMIWGPVWRARGGYHRDDDEDDEGYD